MNDIEKIKNTWCLTPWYEVYLKPEGGVRSCCDNIQESEFQLNEVNGNIDTAFNHDHYKTIRKEMLEGKEPEACKRCYAKERETGSSLRTRRNDKSYLDYLGMESENIEDVMKNLKVDWSPSNIKKLKVDFSNGCNLKCSMCSPHRSTAWFKDKIAMDKEFDYSGYYWWRQIKEPLDADKQKFYSSSIPIEFIDNNWNFLRNLNLIEVSGGEPFFHTQFLYLLDRLVEDKWEGKLTLISNITLMDDDIIKKLSALNTSMCISIDGVGDLYEYIRPATTIGKYTWSDISETIQKLKSLRTGVDERGILYTFGYVPQLLNFYNITDWLDFSVNALGVLDENRVDVLSGTVLYAPHFLKICHHPDLQEKKALKNILDKCYSHIRGVDSIIKGLDAETKPEDWKAFCKYMNFLDKQRETSIIKYIPQFEKYWIYE